jgi:hypothetical protein
LSRSTHWFGVPEESMNIPSIAELAPAPPLPSASRRVAKSPARTRKWKKSRQH